MNKLSAKQDSFCRQYIVDLNATKAAIRAGYSKRSAQGQSSRLLSKAIIKKRVDELLKRKSERVNIDASRVLNAISNVAFDSESTDKDKLKALDMLSKHLGLFEKDNRQSKPDPVQIVVFNDADTE